MTTGASRMETSEIAPSPTSRPAAFSEQVGPSLRRLCSSMSLNTGERGRERSVGAPARGSGSDL
jgi:hypothetical protein